ncbi:MAG: sulfatase [Lentisphaeraceae bacterium]|nr:sulfatase [Lentisphaeraceae bacterium]
MCKYFVCIVSFVFSFYVSAVEKPNVLFISVDDWNATAGYFENSNIKTPNLDKLSKRGVSFTNAHVPAVYCAPSRTSIMVGKNPHNTGCYRDQPVFASFHRPDLKDIPAWFKENGYLTKGAGKLYHHMPGFIDFRGWSEFYHWNENERKSGWNTGGWGEGTPNLQSPNSPLAKIVLEHKKKKNPKAKTSSYYEWGAIPNEQEEAMSDTRYANWAVNFIENYKGDKPFFLGLGFYSPHKPNYAPQKYFDLYPLDEIKIPKYAADDLNDLPPLIKKKYMPRATGVDTILKKHKLRKQALQSYYASISYSDAMIGRVLDALQKSPYFENTIVVLWSDNGFHMGQKNRWDKHTLWRETSNVPFIMAGPGLAKSAKVKTTVSLLDIYPSLIDLCHLPKNDELEGVSLAPVLKNPASAQDRTVLQTDELQFALINQNWRYVKTKGDEEQLYNLKADPFEHKNLATNPEFKSMLEMFRKQLPKNPVKAGIGAKKFKNKKMKLVLKGDSYTWELIKK